MKIVAIIFKLIVVLFFITICFSYFRQQNIVKNENNLKDCIVTKIYCGHGKSGSSKVWIQYKDKTDRVPISVTLCDKLKIGERIKLYYDEDFDYFFKEGYVNIGWVILALVLLVISFTGKQIDKLNAFLKKQH